MLIDILDDRKRMMQEWADYLDKLKRDETGLHS